MPHCSCRRCEWEVCAIRAQKKLNRRIHRSDPQSSEAQAFRNPGYCSVFHKKTELSGLSGLSGMSVLGVRQWICIEGYPSHDREINTAKNILRLKPELLRAAKVA